MGTINGDALHERLVVPEDPYAAETGQVHQKDQDARNKQRFQPPQAQVYSAMQIARVLQLSKSKAYMFLNDVFADGNELFRVIKIGSSIRVEKKSFDDWLHAPTR